MDDPHFKQILIREMSSWDEASFGTIDLALALRLPDVGIDTIGQLRLAMDRAVARSPADGHSKGLYGFVTGFALGQAVGREEPTVRYTDEMAERAEEALREKYPQLWQGLHLSLVEGVVQTVLMHAEGKAGKQTLDVQAASAAVPADADHVEFVLIGTGGRLWEFDLGPVASGSLVLLLTEALEELEAAR